MSQRSPVSFSRCRRACGSHVTEDAFAVNTRVISIWLSTLRDEEFERWTKTGSIRRSLHEVMREVLVIPEGRAGDVGPLHRRTARWRTDVSGGAGMSSVVLVVPGLLCAVVCIVGLVGLFTVSPNEAKVLQLFGSYKGTVREPGLRWVNPFFTKAGHLAQGAELRERAAQSQRSRRQSDRDRRGGRMESG